MTKRGEEAGVQKLEKLKKELMRQIKMTRQEHKRHYNDIMSDYKEVKNQHKELKRIHKQLRSDHDELKSDYRTTCVHRARILATQILLEFLGEQPRFPKPCNYFSELRTNNILRSMVRAAFPEAMTSDKEYQQLLEDFDYVIQGRIHNVHPNLRSVLADEVEDLIRFLKREGRKAPLWRGGFISMRILMAQRKIARCTDAKRRVDFLVENGSRKPAVLQDGGFLTIR